MSPNIDPAPQYPAGLPVPGEVLAGKYRVESVLGVGGMGAVLSARHADLGTLVAVKVLLPDASRDSGVTARLVREAQTAAAIQSDHVVKILDAGQLQAGQPYLVMEHLVGLTVSELLSTRRPLPVTEAVDFVLEACEGLAQAHALDIIHRDIKPSNLFLARLPNGVTTLKVLDFGISKANWLVQRSGELTATLETIGTPAYMSPEQARSSKNVDARTDIWGIGVVLYECVCGSLPFLAETVGGLIAAVAADPPRNPLELNPQLPPGLARVLLSCLEKNPDNRPQTIALLAQQLAPFASDQGRACAGRIARQAPIEALATVPHMALAGSGRALLINRPASPLRRALLGAGIGLAAALVLILAMAVPLTRARRDPAASSQRVVSEPPAALSPAPSDSPPVASSPAIPTAAQPSASASAPPAATSRTPRPVGTQHGPSSPYDDRF